MQAHNAEHHADEYEDTAGYGSGYGSASEARATAAAAHKLKAAAASAVQKADAAVQVSNNEKQCRHLPTYATPHYGMRRWQVYRAQCFHLNTSRDGTRQFTSIIAPNDACSIITVPHCRHA